jgi:hypothetical protein
MVLVVPLGTEENSRKHALYVEKWQAFILLSYSLGTVERYRVSSISQDNTIHP